MSIPQINNRIRTMGPYSREEELRDLRTLIDEINAALKDAQAQITALKGRIDTAGIP